MKRPLLTTTFFSASVPAAVFSVAVPPPMLFSPSASTVFPIFTVPPAGMRCGQGACKQGHGHQAAQKPFPFSHAFFSSTGFRPHFLCETGNFSALRRN